MIVASEVAVTKMVLPAVAGEGSVTTRLAGEAAAPVVLGVQFWVLVAGTIHPAFAYAARGVWVKEWADRFRVSPFAGVFDAVST